MENLRKDVAKIDEKLDKIAEDLSQIKIVQAEQAADIKHHIARTDASEQRIDTVENRLLPLVEFKNKLDGAFLLVGKVGSFLGLFFAAIKCVEVLISYL